MDIRVLRYFATVAELGSFTKAAARLNVAQPALSRQVKQLEERLGLELLSRQGRSICLTEAGEALLRHARSIQRDFERLIEDMQARKATPTGRVVIGIPPALAHVVVPAVVGRIAQQYPAITVQIAEGISPVLAQWLKDNRIDLAVLGLWADEEEAKANGLRQEVLTNEDMVIVEKASGRPVPRVYSRAMLQAKPMVMSQFFERMMRRELEPPELSLTIPLVVDSMLALKAMVLEGQAATVLPVSMMRAEIRQGTVTASAITEHGVRRQLTLTWPKFRQSTQATDAAANVIRDEVRRLSEEGYFTWATAGAHPRTRYAAASARAAALARAGA